MSDYNKLYSFDQYLVRSSIEMDLIEQLPWDEYLPGKKFQQPITRGHTDAKEEMYFKIRCAESKEFIDNFIEDHPEYVKKVLEMAHSKMSSGEFHRQGIYNSIPLHDALPSKKRSRSNSILGKEMAEVIKKADTPSVFYND